MAKRLVTAALALLAAFTMTGCSSVVARVNGTNVTRKEFIEEMERTQGMQVLQATIMRRLIVERATAEGLAPTAEEISARLSKFRQEKFNNDEPEFRKWMKANALDDVVLQEQIRYELTMFKLRTRKLKPTDENLKQFFSEYKEQLFDKPERVTFRQLAVADKKTADQLIAKLNNEGEMFAELARTQSADQGTRENGGLVEDVPWGLIQEQAKPIYDALRKLEPNQITQAPVKVGNGFWVLKMVNSKPAEAAKLEDPKTKELVKEQYLAQNAIPENEVIGEIVKGANVVVLDERYKAALEPLFTAQAAGAQGLSPEAQKAIQDQADKGPEIAPPTPVDEQAMPKPVTPGSGN